MMNKTEENAWNSFKEVIKHFQGKEKALIMKMQ